MKIRDIIRESTAPLRRSAKAAIPDMQMFPQLDNSSIYNMYRYGIALAGSPDPATMDQDGPAKSKMVTIAYSEGDADIINKTNIRMGVKGRAISDKRSHESSTVDTASPVAKPKRNKYGV
jgi:hypothetical protein